jgi:hypothetical protein
MRLYNPLLLPLAPLQLQLRSTAASLSRRPATPDPSHRKAAGPSLYRTEGGYGLERLLPLPLRMQLQIYVRNWSLGKMLK